MIRPFTCLCLAAACGSGLYLYSEKHRTAVLDRDISNVIHQTEAARARTGLLRAEWALLNEPGRLQDMADKYLALKPMAPTQFVQLTDLAAHLPPPGASDVADAADNDYNSDSPATPVSTTPDAAPVAVPVPPAQSTLEAAAPVKHDADLKTDTHEGAAKLLAHTDTRPKPARRAAPADHAYTPPQNGMLARGTPLPLATPQPVSAHIYSAMAHPLPQPAYRSSVAAAPRYVTPYVGSALAGRASLPPPTPYSGDQ